MTMTDLNKPSVLWALWVVLALVAFASYLWAALAGGQGTLLMPLDDVYIHFQYAKQIALGQPYVYNAGAAPTSGATSLLYPLLLAGGWALGLRTLWLGLWAMLMGVVALVASLWAVFRLLLKASAPRWFAVLLTVIFALTGSLSWHFFSGMETGLMIALTLWVLLNVVEKRLWLFVLVGSLLALMRPEGGALAGIAAVTLVLRLWSHVPRKQRWTLLFVALPVLATGVQPLINRLVTGSSVATGNQAKSLLAMVPHDWELIAQRILENFVRMWQEFLTGYGHEGWYLPPLLGAVALLVVLYLLLKPNWRLLGWMLLGWMLALSAAVSTLDTAFWHFKRYQMPLLALFVPLAGWGLTWLFFPASGENRNARHARVRPALLVVLAAWMLFALLLWGQFLGYHRQNVGYIYQQPYQMALWLGENTPDDARVAVHDVGLMRYLGGRQTLDIVGLTTPGAASYWRNGPGSVAEFLIERQPDYIANYGRGHGYGLAFLADTALYANEQAAFHVEDWQPLSNVALAAPFQGIYAPEWSLPAFQQGALDSPYSADTVLFSLNVANLDSERAADYRWHSTAHPGFPTEVHDFQGIVDGIRRIDLAEAFTFAAASGEPLVLLTRVLAQSAGTLDVVLNGQSLGTRWIPESPGTWVTLATILPSDALQASNDVQIIPSGDYYPALHQLQPVNETICCTAADGTLATFQSGRLHLLSVEQQQNHEALSLTLEWLSEGDLSGDYRFFAHLYAETDQPPVAQWDGYLAGQPVGNWLRGNLTTPLTISLHDLETGRYSLAVGFYNPQNPQDRLLPTSPDYETTDDGRLWLGEITVGG